MSEIEKYYNGEIIVDFEEETELEKNYNKVAELYSKAVKKKIEYRKEIERLTTELESANESITWWQNRFNAVERDNERLNNIINTILDFNFFKEECPLNFGYTEKCDEEKAQDVFYEDDYCEENCNDDYKKCWLKYFERLQELKGSNEPSFEEMVGFVENVYKDIKSQSTLHEELEEERKTIAKIVGDFKEVNK